MTLELIVGLALSAALVAVIGALTVSRERTRAGRRLLVAGLMLRVVGGLAYLALLQTVYGGGDYTRYMGEATAVVESEQDSYRYDLTVTELYDGRWWGTPSISILTAQIMRVVGTGYITVFVVYGLISYLAALCFVYAFRGAFPHIDSLVYTRWIMLWPSLWFWPSPVGKDGPVLLGLGLAFLGVVGIRGHRNYLLAALGTAITLAVRPQYAFVFAAALVAGVVLGRRTRGGGVAKALFVAAVLAGATYLVTVSSDFLGFSVTETEETSQWIDNRGTATAYGGSAFEAATDPFTGAFNVLFRPFLWEASGGFVLLSSLEVLALWVLLIRRRRACAEFIRRYHRTEVFWISVLFTILLASAVGMAVGNFGTLVRQRIHLYPFLFILTSSLPYLHAKGMAVRRRVIQPSLAG